MLGLRNRPKATPKLRNRPKATPKVIPKIKISSPEEGERDRKIREIKEINRNSTRVLDRDYLYKQQKLKF